MTDVNWDAGWDAFQDCKTILKHLHRDRQLTEERWGGFLEAIDIRLSRHVKEWTEDGDDIVAMGEDGLIHH